MSPPEQGHIEPYDEGPMTDATVRTPTVTFGQYGKSFQEK